jgi:hypothetical protein
MLDISPSFIGNFRAAVMQGVGDYFSFVSESTLAFPTI